MTENGFSKKHCISYEYFYFNTIPVGNIILLSSGYIIFTNADISYEYLKKKKSSVKLITSSSIRLKYQ